MTGDGSNAVTPAAQMLQRGMSRRRLLTAAGFGLVLAAVPGAVRAAGTATGEQEATYPLYPPVKGTYTPEQVDDILAALVTASYFAATGYTLVVSNAAKLGLTGLPLAITQAGAAAEQYHIDFLTSIGATPLTTTFTASDPTILNSAQGSLAASETSSTIQVAMYIAAVREFSELGQPILAKWAAQTLGNEAEQRVALRTLQALLGTTTAAPPNNKAFETELVLYVRDAIAIYRALGFIGGSGATFAYPGRDAVLAAAGPMASAVTQKTPNDAGSTVVLSGPASLLAERP